MSSKTRAAATAAGGGIAGSFEGTYADPRKCVILEDDPGHKYYMLHESRRVIDPKWVKAMKHIGAPIPVFGKVIDGVMVIEGGRRRTRHARVACDQLEAEGKEPFPIRVLPPSMSADQIASVENAYRMSESVHAEAVYYRDHVAKYGEEKAQALTDVSKFRGERLIKLLACSPRVIAAVDVGVEVADPKSDGDTKTIKVPLKIVDDWGGMKHADQDAALDKLIAAGTARGQKARDTARNEATGSNIRTTIAVSRKAYPVVAQRLASSGSPDLAALVTWLADMSQPLPPDLAAALGEVVDEKGALKPAPKAPKEPTPRKSRKKGDAEQPQDAGAAA